MDHASFQSAAAELQTGKCGLPCKDEKADSLANRTAEKRSDEGLGLRFEIDSGGHQNISSAIELGGSTCDEHNFNHCIFSEAHRSFHLTIPRINARPLHGSAISVARCGRHMFRLSKS